MSIMYGNNVKVDDAYSRATSDAAYMAHNLMLPTFTLLNFFPILHYIPAWFPMAEAQRMIRDTKRLTGMLVSTPIDMVKDKLVCRFSFHPDFPSTLKGPLIIAEKWRRRSMHSVSVFGSR